MPDPNLPPGAPQSPAQPPQAPKPAVAYGHPDYVDLPVEETSADEFQDKTWQDAKDMKAAEAEAGYAPGEAPVVEYEEHDGPAVIQTDVGSRDGLAKCPRCGATEIALNVATGMLRCAFCRHEWQEESAVKAFNLDTPISALRGITMGSGADEIIPGTDQILSFKCSACGAEVVIDTNQAMQARCHWCRNTLSMNEQMPNGAVPDALLPFSLPKEVAVTKIADFVNSRKFFANRKFKAEFNAENVIGVYLPYLIIDVNAKVNLAGFGEHETRRYTVGSDDNKRTVYDADVYRVERHFDLYVNDLTLESAADKSDINVRKNTNNIVNSVLPFDTDNIVRFNANYLSGFSSQRRDTNIDGVSQLALTQARDIGRYKARDTLRFYDRGVRWEQENFEPVGQRWVSAYLPVWLYSYYEKKPNGNELLHYIAVNGRTGETMGSVPINMRRLWVAASIAQAIGTLTTILLFAF